MCFLLSARLLVLAVVFSTSCGIKCTISAELHKPTSTTSNPSFRGGNPVMVDILKGQKVTVRCTGPGVRSIHFRRPMMGNKIYEEDELELTAETFKPGYYHCKCHFQGASNTSLPLALTGENKVH